MYVEILLLEFYRPQRSWGKVIFSQASVILFGGGCASLHAGIPSPRGQAGIPQGPGRHHQGQAPPPKHTGRYGQRVGGIHPTGMQSCSHVLDHCSIIQSSSIVVSWQQWALRLSSIETKEKKQQSTKNCPPWKTVLKKNYPFQNKTVNKSYPCRKKMFAKFTKTRKKCPSFDTVVMCNYFCTFIMLTQNNTTLDVVIMYKHQFYPT